jgi:hypothetical protein
MIVLSFSQASAQQPTGQSGQQGQAHAQGISGVTTVTAGEIAQNPTKYYGQKVSVRAEVDDVLGRQVFALDEDELFAWPDVLVIAPPLTGFVPEDQIVTVTGTVRSCVDLDFRLEYDWDWWKDLDTDLSVTFENRPVIVADSVRDQAGTELVLYLQNRAFQAFTKIVAREKTATTNQYGFNFVVYALESLVEAVESLTASRAIVGAVLGRRMTELREETRHPARVSRSDAPLSRQPDVIERFFEHASKALQAIDASFIRRSGVPHNSSAVRCCAVVWPSGLAAI